MIQRITLPQVNELYANAYKRFLNSKSELLFEDFGKTGNEWR